MVSDKILSYTLIKMLTLPEEPSPYPQPTPEPGPEPKPEGAICNL